MNRKQNNAFTIVEMLVAMALAIIVMGLASVIFARAVTAYRKAAATIEITRRADAICQQLTSDFRGLRKDGEIFLAWVAAPEIDDEGALVTPTRYQRFDRIVFFANGNFQTYKAQETKVAEVSKQIAGNLARVSYVPAKDAAGVRAAGQKDRKQRILARTQHIITADADFNAFPDLTAAWNPADFETKNAEFEYQTLTMADWTNLSDAANLDMPKKNNILTTLSDIPNILAADPLVTQGGPIVDKTDSGTYHNYFAEGVGEFGIQIWRDDPINPHWYPQMDPNGDGDYSDGDYPTTGTDINYGNVDGILYNGTGEGSFGTMKADVTWVPLKFTALKFTFTLYDSKGLFSEGRTFTHIVMIDN